MIAPMIDPKMPEAWIAPSSKSSPKSTYPRNPPTNEPMMPTRTVCQKLSASRPGRAPGR